MEFEVIVEVPEGSRNKYEVPPPFLREIAHFFAIYKDLEPGKSTEVGGWHGRGEAEREIARAYERAGTAHPEA